MRNCRVGPETARVLENGHPWVIADRYTKAWARGRAGELIGLHDQQGRFLATALYAPGERIVARVLDCPGPVLEHNWLEEKLRCAQELRRHALLGETDCYRLVNSEGDGLPGLTLDRYGDYLMLQFYTPAWDVHLDLLKEAVSRVYAPRGLYLKERPRDTRKLAARSPGGQHSRLVLGQAAPVPLQVRENGLSYLVDLRRGLHTGLFPDQRNNRREFMSRAQNCRVLNLFAFTGAFSVAAAAGGAQQVTSVDVSEKYLAVARQNFSLNHLDPQQHRIIVGDVFAVLGQLGAHKERFDLILFDPPSFSTTRKSRFATQGGTARLVAETLPLLVPGGLLASSSNHQKISDDAYFKELRRGARMAGAELVTLRSSGQAEDFPYPVGFPEGRYLKFVISAKTSA